MMILRFFAKIILLPIWFLALVLKLAVTLVTKACSVAVTLFWVALVGVGIMLITQQQYMMLIFVALFAVAAFLIMLFSVGLMVMFEDLCKGIGRYIFS